MKDKEIICKDCGKTFIHSVEDQEFYKKMNFQNEPVRCKECRDKKKNERGNFNFKRNDNFNKVGKNN